MKRIVINIFLLLFCLIVKSQNDVQFSHYFYSGTYYNPSAVNIDKTINFSCITRNQWVGYNGAPVSQNFDINYYFKNIGGIGINVLNDKIGIQKLLAVKLAYCKNLKINEDFDVSLGISGGMNNIIIDGTTLIYEEADDDYAYNLKESKIRPDFDVGFNLKYKKMTTSFSSKHIHQNLLNSDVFNLPRSFYFSGKYEIDFSNNIRFYPLFFYKYSNKIIQYDLSFLCYFPKYFWVGISYRNKESIIGILGINVMENISIGYSYDFNYSVLRPYSKGSHEFYLSYRIKVLEQEPVLLRSTRMFDF